MVRCSCNLPQPKDFTLTVSVAVTETSPSITSAHCLNPQRRKTRRPCSVSVSIYPEHVEVWNTGKLPRGITPRDLLLASHPSILVNPDIGHVFYLHELMERVGRGTFKIAQECRDLGMRVPEWKDVGSGVRLTMFAAKAGKATRPERAAEGVARRAQARRGDPGS